MNVPRNQRIDAVATLLQGIDHIAVAVSGGIDSLTLATIASRTHGPRTEMFHAVSPAVPPEATQRVRDFAMRESWRLHIIDAAEFEREEYVSNPSNRCFYCKRSLYSVIAESTSAQIVSGTNVDDLHEYRPGLEAARVHGVRHPYAELGVTKADIRNMAESLSLGGIAELPASPCLSSRVETGIRITPALLRLIHAAELAVRGRVTASSIRCRLRKSGVVIEIDEGTLSRLTAIQRDDLLQAAARVFAAEGDAFSISLARYRVGSAFLLTQND
jgi:uncharacterized protein